MTTRMSQEPPLPSTDPVKAPRPGGLLQHHHPDLLRKIWPAWVDMMGDIKDFHEKFKLAGADGPSFLSDQVAEFRIKFLQEELDEYKKAVKECDLPGQFDALIDLVYVALGTAYLQGFPWAEGWREVQRANMSKIRVENASESKRGSSFDVRKPPDWVGPDIIGILEDASEPTP